MDIDYENTEMASIVVFAISLVLYLVASVVEKASKDNTMPVLNDFRDVPEFLKNLK